MGFRFRKSFRMFPGGRINLGKRGVSASFGVRRAGVTLGRRTSAHVGIPSAGLSYVANIGSGRRRKSTLGQFGKLIAGLGALAIVLSIIFG